MRTATAVLMRAKNIVLGSGPRSSVDKKGSMANSEFSSTSTHYSLDRLSPLEGTTGASAAAVTRRGHGGRAAALTSTLVAMMAVVVAMMLAVASDAQAAIGENFSFAPTATEAPDPVSSAPAFPGARAFWAGVCDMADGAAAIGAPPPSAPRSNCIEHRTGSSSLFGGAPDATVPPLAPGVPAGSAGADGWYTGFQGVTGALTMLGGAPSWRLADVTGAGAHADGTASFWLSRAPDSGFGAGIIGDKTADGATRSVTVRLPPGVVGNPRAVPQCPSEALTTVPPNCPPETQVGTSTIALSGLGGVFPVYNVEPRDGNAAELVIAAAGHTSYNTNVMVTATARTDDDFSIEAMSVEIPAGFPLMGQTFTLWGVPWAASHDRFRPVAAYCGQSSAGTPSGMLGSGLPGGFGGRAPGCSQEPQPYDPSWGPIKPFLTTQTECAASNPVTRISATNWHTSVIATATSQAPLLDGCEDVQFDASFLMQATSPTPDSASGLNVDLSVPQNNDPPHAKRFNADDDDPESAVAHWKSTAGLARSHLKDSFVTLPEGFSVNPSAATGLVGCSDAQIGVTNAASNPLVFNDGDPFNKDGGADGAECPDGSIVGTAEVTTPLLEEKLTGEVVLGEAKSTDPQSGQMFRLFIVVRNHERGLVAKIHGTTTADGVVGEGGNGQLRATFENNPRVPFSNLKLSFKGGSKGILATPQGCGGYDWTSTFTAWSGAPAVPQGGQFPVSGDCSTGFAPTLAAGMDTQSARSHGSFSFRFARNDGEQWFNRLTAILPTGLLASVRDLPLCTSAQAATGSCPLGSQIGVLDAKAGSGDPFVLERKGEVFLTEGYKGGEYGLMVKVRPIAGPFRGAMELSPIVVRQAIHVDRRTAQVTAISDPFPLIHHGIPLRVREVLVNVDRPNFMLNPSDCSPKQVQATILSAEGTRADVANHFQASGCANLRFRPRLNLRLTGRRQVRTGRHPGVRAVVRQQGIGEAGIAKAEVRLPKSLALDVDNAQALCEFEDGTKPDLENHCPKGSIVGRARAVTPLLNRPLVGNVYFVKNIRIDPDTGNEIRTLPMIIVALRGEIAVNLVGESSTTRSGKLVNTFDEVPDAPVSRFNLNIRGGSNGILAVTRTRRSNINLCAKPNSHVAEADMDGQNGRRHDFNVRMKTPCSKRQTRAAKRNAKRAAAMRAAKTRRSL